jgi:hypothetical protein
MAGRIHRWLALTGSQRARLFVLALALPLIEATLRLFGYKRTRLWLERRSRQAGMYRASPGDVVAAQDLANLASIAGRHGPVTATCLRQSLLVYWLLRRRGFDPRLRLGVRKQSGVFDAHAWVELEGIALAQRDLTHEPMDLKRGHV